MPIVPIRDLGLAGVLPDKAPYNLPPNGLSDCLNMRLQDKKLVRTKGWSSFLNLTTDFTEVFGTFIYPIYAIPAFGPNDGLIIIASDQFEESTAQSFGLGGVFANAKNDEFAGVLNQAINVKFFFFTGSSVTDISPDTDRIGSVWQWRDINNGVIVNNGTSTPMIWTQDKSKFEDIANFPTDTTVDVFVKYKEFYIGLNTTESGKNFKNKIMWSGVINPDTNEADWSFADTTSLAGFNYISDDVRGIRDAVELNDQLFIYTLKKVTSMQFTGDEFVFRFRDVIEDGGSVANGLVVNLENTQLAISGDDVYVHDGNIKQTIAVGRIRKTLFTRASSLAEIKCFKNPVTNEIIIAFREGNASSFNTALVYSYDYDAYTFIELPSITDYSIGIEISDSIPSWDNIDPLKSWEVESNSWSSIGGISNELKPYGASPLSNTIYKLDDTWRQDGEEYVSRFTRTNFDFDEYFQDSTQIKSVQKVWPQFDGDGTVKIRWGGSNFPQGPLSWDAFYTFVMNQDDEVDVRTTWRYLSFECQKDGGGAWEATGMDIELVGAGRR